MSGEAIVFMVVICSVIWGGFLLLLGWMMKCERGKATSRSGESVTK